MREYAPQAIRNAVLAGHSGSGKTTLLEACLHGAGITDRLGRVEDGNTFSDHSPEEIRRKSSVFSTLLAFEYSNCKFNLFDTPGYADFWGEVVTALTAVESCVLVINASEPFETGFSQVLAEARKQDRKLWIFINGLDRERADFDRVFNDLKNKFHLPVVALNYPLGRESNLRGTIDVLAGKAYEEKGRTRTATDIPSDVSTRIEELRQSLTETAVECDDGLMEQYLEGGELTVDQINDLLHRSILCGCSLPVLCGSAAKQIGTVAFMEAFARYAASAVELPVVAKNNAGENISIEPNANSPFVGRVFRTLADPHAGRQTWVKVASGTLRKDADVAEDERDTHERFAHLYTACGKKITEIPSATAGDIVFVTKLKNARTGDTLGHLDGGVHFSPPEYPESLYSVALHPKTRGADDKLAESLGKLCEEDPTLKMTRNGAGQMVLSGVGDVHINIAIARLKNQFGVEVELGEPRVEYFETIRKSVKAEGKLKKQSGGHGQFADVFIELSPQEPATGFVFEDKIVGGVVPRAFIPAVEEGVREALREGPLAGYPLVDVKVTLYDGKFHDVDSSYQTFKIAGSMALRNGAREASPTLLEPVMEVAVTVPEASAGDIVSDLNGRRGQILGMETQLDGTVRVSANVPDAELRKYPITLRSITHGHGYFTKKFSHYSALNDNVAQKVIELHHTHKTEHAGAHNGRH